jgi:hypothetical protein
MRMCALISISHLYTLIAELTRDELIHRFRRGVSATATGIPLLVNKTKKVDFYIKKLQSSWDLQSSWEFSLLPSSIKQILAFANEVLVCQ